jgi:hypothetical protein
MPLNFGTLFRFMVPPILARFLFEAFPAKIISGSFLLTYC